MEKNNSDTLHSSKHDLKRKHDESDKKSKKRKKKHKRRKESTSSSDLGERKKVKKHKKKKDKKSKTGKNDSTSEEIVADVPLELMSKSKAMAPMTKEEWDKRQSIIRRVYDEESGRNRLIKGDGEVIEEIVSLKRHKEINKTATQGDGAYFQSKIIAKLN